MPFEYSGHQLDVVDLAWSPRNVSDGRYLLSASLDKTVRLWHTSKKGVCLCVFYTSKVCKLQWIFILAQRNSDLPSGCFDSKCAFGISSLGA